MGFEIITKIKIAASAERVWEVFSDFNRYKDWNPFIKSIDGVVAPGNQIHVTIDGMSFKPKVLEFVKNRKLVWKGALLHPVLFAGTHGFEIEPLADGSSIFHHYEQFGGILLPLMKRKLSNETKTGFENMNITLKAKAEGK